MTHFQACCPTTSSVCRWAPCCPRCPRWTTCSPGSTSCSCWPLPAWLWSPAPSSGASARGVSSWPSSPRMDLTRIRRCSDPAGGFIRFYPLSFQMPSALQSKHFQSSSCLKKPLRLCRFWLWIALHPPELCGDQ